MLVSLLLLDEVFNDGAPSAERIPSIEDLNDDVRAVDDLVAKNDWTHDVYGYNIYFYWRTS